MSYSGDPESTTRDWVRARIGDVDEEQEFLADAEYDSIIDAAGDSPVASALEAIRWILARLSRHVDYRMHGVTVSASQAREHFLQTMQDLSGVGSDAGAALAYAGGISQADKDTREADTDRIPTSFKRGMHEPS
jgi:hypothetical protein